MLVLLGKFSTKKKYLTSKTKNLTSKTKKTYAPFFYVRLIFYHGSYNYHGSNNNKSARFISPTLSDKVKQHVKPIAQKKKQRTKKPHPKNQPPSSNNGKELQEERQGQESNAENRGCKAC
jgi:hypothetical protein